MLALALSACGESFDDGMAAYQAGDYDTALKFWRPLAEQGHAQAQHALGVLYHNGEGVPRDDAEAAKWFRLAAEQGNAGAQYSVGLLFHLGHGVEQDYEKAAKWYRKAAGNGDASAPFNLALMYESGKGVPRDEAEAVRWYETSIRNGPDISYAYNNLSWLLSTSPDPDTRDGGKAVELALRAFDGDPDSMDTLAAAYAEAGRFADAVLMQEMAVGLKKAQGKEESIPDFETRLNLYRQNKPYRSER